MKPVEENQREKAADRVGDMLEGLLNEVMEAKLEGADLELYRQTIWNMTNHTPSSTDISKIETLRTDFKVTAGGIVNFCPPSRERSLAITHLEDGLMWAVAAIARAKPAASTDSGYSE